MQNLIIYSITILFLVLIAAEALVFRDDSLNEARLHLNRLAWLVIRMIFYAGVVVYGYFTIRAHPFRSLQEQLVGSILLIPMMGISFISMVFLALMILLELVSRINIFYKLLAGATREIDLGRRLMVATLFGLVLLFLVLSLAYAVLSAIGSYDHFKV